MNSQLFKRPQFSLAMLGLAALAAIGVSLPRLNAPGALDALRLPPAGRLTTRNTAGELPGAETARAAFERLQARADGRLDAHWNENTGIPDFLAGADPATRIPYTPTAAERGNPLAIARGFLDENRALFDMTSADADLQFVRMEPDHQLAFKHVRMAQAYQGLPVNNFIDEKSYARFRQLGLLPSAPCSDAEFLRRASLDSTTVRPAC